MVSCVSRRSSMPFWVVASASNTAEPMTCLMSSVAPLPDLWPGTPNETLPELRYFARASRIGAWVWSPVMAFPSDSFEIAGNFPVGDPAIEFRLLPACSAHVMIDHGIPESGPHDGGIVQRSDRLPQGLRDFRHAVDQISIAFAWRFQVQPLLQAVQPGGDQRGKRE